MENQTPKPRVQLDRKAWVLAAIELLAKEGVTGLRVELLAKHQKVTKGSFYWHFKDRRDLLDAVLDYWKDGRIRDIVKQTRAEPGQELAQIHHVIDVYSTSRSRRGIMIELAVRDWAKRDAVAAAVVEEVDTKRLECARALFLACGVPMAEASSRSMLLYAYVFGVSLMFCDRYAPDLDALKRDIADLIARSASSRREHSTEAG
ncbi:TetR/AcrR family transcriptional regulator [Nitrogeniibacter mangrovi]|uniref:TetR/AcrR family transcriptional regulator n=1 Tax=Nitrogeniibacter mangrovi TaxID=2016596 RepID=A0A6C1B5J8_9RHOO|nr:TetR/AcrR family transcriptional regulator [Nitrogeniibacter mangrovi]QID17514.1 TetR/AcrR family transcriptional regulator [Nitrogeniibacter mangrovi]